MTALLTENLPLLAGAPNGIKKLRELILELAVRGKLVPQDPSDEPASELLKRIATEQARLVVEEDLRTKAQADVPQKDQYLQVSAGWAYSRLGNLARFIDYRGRTPTKTKSGIPLITAKNVRVGFISRDPQEFIGEDDYLSWMTRGFPRVGDVLFTTEAPMGNIALVDISEKFALAQRVICFQLHELSIGPFLKLAMMSSTFQSQLLEVATGMTATGIKSSRLKEIPVLLPPLAEQQRVVAKVDELMALCDRLEAQQADAESAHARLVQALLDSLTQASDATEFSASWKRLAEHFHTLFTTESSIDALKQTLLQLAVMGKLVAQDFSDESAERLLARITSHRANRREKKQKLIADISEAEKPFKLPAQWVWTTFPAVGELARGKSRHRPRNDPSLYAGGNIPLIQTGDVARANGIVNTQSAKYNTKGLEQSRLWPAGTMCITIAANIADSAILGFDACFPDSVVGFIPELPELDVRYFEFFLRTAKSHLEDFAPSTAQKNINLEILGLLLVPLPPAREIRRIVAKVDQLVALCDQLKTRLTQARQLNQQLTSTLVEHAVA